MMNKPKAFSYLRFSTQNQIKGDSSRRQTEAAQAYAERHGLDLDDELTFRDLGVSAFRGANIVEGALGKFLEAVDSGKVQPGSYLLVENLDRLSRDKIMPALNRFSSLLEKGITVVTLSDGKCYDADSLNNLPDLMLSLLVMSRANEESELKSLRGKAAWKKKRERAAKEGHILTAKAPAWLQLRDGEFKVIKDRAAVVQRIFHMALDGHGKEGIAYRLNKERVKPFGEKSNGWYPSYVRNILANEAVIGRFQPMRDAWVGGKRRHEPDGDVIEGYYPAILDPEIFYRARRAPPGASGSKGMALSNVLNRLVFCSKCGGAMHYVNKGKPPKGRLYLACDNARRKHTCDAKSTRYDPVMNAVLSSLDIGEEVIRDLLGNGDIEGHRQELIHHIEATDGQIDELQAGTVNLLDVLSRQPSPAIETRLAETESNVVQLRQDKADLEAELHSLKDGQDHLGGTLQAMSEVRRVLDKGDDEQVGEMRVRLNGALRRLISRIDIGAIGNGHPANLGHGRRDLHGDRDPGRGSVARLWDNFRALPDKLSRPVVPIRVTFHEEDRHLLIYAHPKDPQKNIALAGRTSEPDKVKLIAHYRALEHEVLDVLF